MPDLKTALDLVYRRSAGEIYLNQVKPLLTGELIEAHRRNPWGPHGCELEFVLTYIRRHFCEMPRYIVICTRPESEYSIARHPRARGRAIELTDERFASEKEIQHAIFLKRLSDLEAMWHVTKPSCDEEAR
jgi:hypothetical protein